MLYLAGLGVAAWLTVSKPLLTDNAALMDKMSSVIIGAAFWSVLFVGIADAILSFGVEGLHAVIFGDAIANKIGLSHGGMFIHIPLMLVALGISLRDRSVSVVWLILMVVLAELLIVLARSLCL